MYVVSEPDSGHFRDDPISDPDSANCTILSPMDLNLGNLLFDDRLYVTTKLKYYTRESVCAGVVADIDGDGKLSAEEPCIGTESSGAPHSGSERVIYSAGLEFLKMQIVHAVFNPWAADKKKHCLVPGDIGMAPISEGSACKDYLMDPAVGSDPSRWTDGDAQAAMSGEGMVTAHGTCADGDVLLLGQLLRASEMDAIEEAAEETGGLEECGAWDTVMQIFPWGSFWPVNCPSVRHLSLEPCVTRRACHVHTAHGRACTLYGQCTISDPSRSQAESIAEATWNR
eukprot:COSAG01_NODE_1864_length_9036_cov_10.407519_7_plen_284_part_00